MCSMICPDGESFDNGKAAAHHVRRCSARTIIQLKLEDFVCDTASTAADDLSDGSPAASNACSMQIYPSDSSADSVDDLTIKQLFHDICRDSEALVEIRVPLELQNRALALLASLTASMPNYSK